MWIREDLKDIMKKIFSLDDFHYEGIGKSIYEEDLLILSDGNKKIAIEVIPSDTDFYVYEIEASKLNKNLYCRKNFKIAILCYSNGKTKLKFNGITEFDGKAFDFDAELVVLNLERGTPCLYR